MWPAWKCDLIFINDNHMEHDCMIYSRKQQTAAGWRRDESRVFTVRGLTFIDEVTRMKGLIAAGNRREQNVTEPR